MRLACLVSLMIVALGALGCPSEYPGEPVGTYAVTAAVGESSCGPGIGGSGPLEFEVEIRRDGEVGYWIGPDGLARVGRIDEQGTYRFKLEQRIQVRAGDAQTAPCVMDQVDEVTGTAAGSLIGTEALAIAVTAGADCSDQMGITTGKFLALPCEIRWELEGAAKEDETE